MTGFYLVFFSAMMVGLIRSWVSHRVFRCMEQKYPDQYVALGRPYHLYSNIWDVWRRRRPRAQQSVFGYFWRAEYKALNDAEMNRKCVLLKNLTILDSLLCVAVLVAFAYHQLKG